MSGRINALRLAELAADRLHDASAPALTEAQVRVLQKSEIYGALATLPSRGGQRDTLILVMPAAERAATEQAEHGVTRLMTMVITVAIAVRAPNDPRARRALKVLIDSREAVMDALAGWKPEGAASALAHGVGRLMRPDGVRAWWEDDYTLDVWVQHKEQP